MSKDNVVQTLDWLYSLPRSRVPEMEPRVEQLLAHEHPFVREEAIRILVTRWKSKRLRKRSMSMMLNDDSEEVRSAAAYSLSAIADEQTLDEHTEALRGLLRNPQESPTLKRSAYESLLIMYRRAAFPRGSEFNPEDDIDWPWVDSL